MPDFRTAVSSGTAREDLRNISSGVLSEPDNLLFFTATAIPTANAASGTMALALVGLRAGDLVTNILVDVTTNGASLTFVKMGLFTATGGFLAATASASASFNAGTTPRVQSVALTSPYRISTDGGYYLGYLQYGSGATGATLARVASTIPQIGTSPLRYGSVALQTDISADVTVAAPITNFWIACN